MNISSTMLIFIKLSFFVIVFCLLIGHGSPHDRDHDHGHSSTPPPPPPLPKPCNQYVRINIPYYCIDDSYTAQDIQAIAHLDVINRDLIITKTNLSDLEFMSAINTITGKLTIGSNLSLTSISSFPNLSYVASLEISDNPKLVDLQGLAHVEPISGEIIIERNGSLVSLVNLQFDHTIQSLAINKNQALQDIGAANNLLAVTETLSITNNGLSNLSDLGKLINVGNLTIGEPNIEYLFGLENLKSVGTRISIIGCQNLLGLDGLSSLSSFDSLLIQSNGSLLSLSTLPSIPSSLDRLVITDNALLGDVGNLAGLSNVNQINISGNNGLINLQGLNDLANVSADIRIEDNASLISLSALSILKHAGSLYVARNIQLSELGLLTLNDIGSKFVIQDNTKLCRRSAIDLLAQVLAGGGVGGSGNTTSGITVTGNLRCVQ